MPRCRADPEMFLLSPGLMPLQIYQLEGGVDPPFQFKSVARVRILTQNGNVNLYSGNPPVGLSTYTPESM
jgi:hypothetical protein